MGVQEQAILAVKQKIAAGATGGSFLSTLMAFMAENKDAVTAVAASVGAVVTVITGAVTIYYTVKLSQAKLRIHDEDLKNQIKAELKAEKKSRKS